MTPPRAGIDYDPTAGGEQPGAQANPKGGDVAPTQTPTVSPGAAGTALIWNGAGWETTLVGAANLAANAVTTASLAANAVTAAKLAAGVLAGPWEALALGAKLEQVAGFQAVGVRALLGGAVAELRGVMAVKAANEYKPGETLFTIPAGFRPPSTLNVAAMFNNEAGQTQIEVNAATGVTVGVGLTLPATSRMRLDGVTFNLT